ncbi:hypothetical protein AX14_008865, partial [Amanita brunnescens Koide BX004]
AKVALTHDDEWSDHLPRDFITDPLNPNVDGLLENIKQAYTVAVDQHDSVVLVSRKELSDKGKRRKQVIDEEESNEQEPEEDDDDGDNDDSESSLSRLRRLTHHISACNSTEEDNDDSDNDDSDEELGLSQKKRLRRLTDHTSAGNMEKDLEMAHDLHPPASGTIRTDKKRQQHPYSCPFPNCGVKFTAMRNLNYHVNSHNNIRPYKCPYESNGCTYPGAAAPRTAKRHSITCKYGVSVSR